MEWRRESKYNSFNSYKGLAYYEHYKNTVKWLDGEEKLCPPIECNLDPFAECNLNCYFCIVQRYIKNHREEVGLMRKLPTEYIYRLVDFLSSWGVKGLCISGGGEPSLHAGIWGIPQYAVSKGIDVSFVTNGVNISDKLAENLMSCRWVALSVDSGNREQYKVIKGRDSFDKVVSNIKRLSELRRKTNAKVDLCFKCLILPENMYSIYEICKLAKEIGVQDFHIRPVDFERKDINGYKKLAINVERVNDEFTKCHELETPDFRVYTITHKFDPKFHVKHDFSKCFPTLIMPLLTDGNIYLCVDKKMDAKFRVGSAFPDPEELLKIWGSDSHKELIKSVDINQCSRCTGSQYNAQIENTVIQDRMCLSFP